MTRMGAFICMLWAGVVAAQSFPSPPTEADWASARCARQADGSVLCAAAAFRVLTDDITDSHATIEKMQAQLDAKAVQVDALKAALLAIPPPVPQPSHSKPVVAVATAVLGSLALTSALFADSLKLELRVGLGLAGAGAVASSFIIVF